MEIANTLAPTQMHHAAFLWTAYSSSAPAVNPRAHDFFPFLLLNTESLCTALSLIQQERTYGSPGSLVTALATLLAPARWLQAWIDTTPTPPQLQPCIIHNSTALKMWIAFFRKKQNLKGPTWLPHDPTKVVSLEQAARLQQAMHTDPLALAAWLSFVCGRRICDILRIAIPDIFSKMATPAPSASPLLGLSALLIDHKTAGSQGCFAVHLPDSLEPVLQRAITAAQAQRSSMLFGTTDWRANEHIIKQRYLSNVDIRGLRRGGLCQASQVAENDEDLLVLSDHTSTKALKTYLGGGLLSASRRRKQIHFVESTIDRITEVASRFPMQSLPLAARTVSAPVITATQQIPHPSRQKPTPKETGPPSTSW